MVNKSRFAGAFVFTFSVACAIFAFQGRSDVNPPEPRTPASNAEAKAQTLPKLDGLPTYDPASQITTAQEVKAAGGAKEAACKKKVPAALRAMVFQHYLHAQALENAQGHYFNSAMVLKWSHLLGMILKESGGDPADVTDMNGKEVGSYKAMDSIAHWKSLFSHDLTYDKQTNYGIAQQSLDRLQVGSPGSNEYDRFLGAGANLTDGEYVMRLLGLYQQFAQGRLSNSDTVITKAELRAPNAPPDLVARAHLGVQAALWYCGTRFLYKEGYTGAVGQKTMEDAMASIAYCDVTNISAGKKCAASWLTLCPALNLDIGLLTPDSYFQTRKTSPVCGKTFVALTTKKPK